MRVLWELEGIFLYYRVDALALKSVAFLSTFISVSVPSVPSAIFRLPFVAEPPAFSGAAAPTVHFLTRAA